MLSHHSIQALPFGCSGWISRFGGYSNLLRPPLVPIQRPSVHLPGCNWWCCCSANWVWRWIADSGSGFSADDNNWFLRNKCPATFHPVCPWRCYVRTFAKDFRFPAGRWCKCWSCLLARCKYSGSWWCYPQPVLGVECKWTYIIGADAISRFGRMTVIFDCPCLRIV